MRDYRALFGPLIVVVLFVIGIVWSPFEPHRPPSPDAPGPPTAPISGLAGSGESAWPDDDWTFFAAKIEWALEHGIDTLPIGRAMAELGRSFVGTAYVPGTLEVAGPERLVINFQGLDCVTFVENVFAMTRFIGMGESVTGLARPRVEWTYEALLREIRYRNGAITGYPSRLHYFSDWVTHHDERGLVDDVSEGLGGARDTEPIDFMTTHSEAYRQLADPTIVEAVREREGALSVKGRYFVPQDRIGSVAAMIQDGDIIAATSTVEGLDVAHTGLALWVDGSLHLLHAPLVGEAVQISGVPLAERIQRIEGQDGIIIARPLER